MLGLQEGRIAKWKLRPLLPFRSFPDGTKEEFQYAIGGDEYNAVLDLAYFSIISCGGNVCKSKSEIFLDSDYVVNVKF